MALAKGQQLANYGDYRDGRQEGPWLTYDQQKLIGMGIYRAGRQHGPWYYPDRSPSHSPDNSPSQNTGMANGRLGLVHEGIPIGPWLHQGKLLDRGAPTDWQTFWQQPTPNDMLWHAKHDDQLKAVVHFRQNKPILLWHEGQLLTWTGRGPQLLGELGGNCLILGETSLPAAHLNRGGTGQPLNASGIPAKGTAIRLDDTDRLRGSSQAWQATRAALLETPLSDQPLLRQQALPDHPTTHPNEPRWRDPYLRPADIQALRPSLPSASVPLPTPIDEPDWHTKKVVPAQDGFDNSAFLESAGQKLTQKWLLLLPDLAHVDSARRQAWLASWQQATSDEAPVLLVGSLDPDLTTDLATDAKNVFVDSDFTVTDTYQLRTDQPSLVFIGQRGTPTKHLSVANHDVPSGMAIQSIMLRSAQP